MLRAKAAQHDGAKAAQHDGGNNEKSLPNLEGFFFE